jgi:hypothetical protein
MNTKGRSGKEVNEALEDLGGIGWTKMHEEEFENTERGDN